LPSAMAAAASDSSCRDEAVEVGGELDAADEAVDDEEFDGDLDMPAGAVLWLLGRDVKGAAVMELSSCIVSLHGELVTVEPH